jgi:hypothetical protein
MNNVDLWPILRRRFPESEYALMQEVSNAAGHHRTNSADYIAVNLWPSRGLAIHGIERKTYRGDWLRELKSPAKAESIIKNCDFFWLLTDSEEVAKREEIPATWGWITVKGTKMYTMKEAPKLSPEPISRHFMCAMLKRACNKDGFVHRDSITSAIDEAVDQRTRTLNSTVERLQEELSKTRKLHQEFFESSGVKIGIWDPPKKIGEAVRFILNGGVDDMKKDLNRMKFTLEKLLSETNKQLEIYESCTDKSNKLESR